MFKQLFERLPQNKMTTYQSKVSCISNHFMSTSWAQLNSNQVYLPSSPWLCIHVCWYRSPRLETADILMLTLLVHHHFHSQQLDDGECCTSGPGVGYYSILPINRRGTRGGQSYGHRRGTEGHWDGLSQWVAATVILILISLSPINVVCGEDGEEVDGNVS